jgi:hypothetical protein
MTGLAPKPGSTTYYQYEAFVWKNETVDGNGNKIPIDFKLRVFASAIKLNHAWKLKLLGGSLDSYVAIPWGVFEELRLPNGPASTAQYSKFAMSNVGYSPLQIQWHKGMAHWILDTMQAWTPGVAYSSADVLNIGQHNVAWGPAFSITLLPHKGRQEFGSRTTYIINGYDKVTHYRSGNEFMDEFTGMQELSKKWAVGAAGTIYYQTTDDRSHGARFQGGNRGRSLQIGPQVRYSMPYGGMAVKYYRDTLVQNQAKGNTLWFQYAVPFNGLQFNKRKE